MRVQHADERQVAVTLGKVQPVADDEQIRNLEADVIRIHFFHAARGLVQQHADFDPARLERADFWQHAAHGLAGVEDVVHQQHVAPADVEPQLLGEDQFAGFRAGAVAGNAYEIQAQRQVQMPDQIREEHHGAVEQRDDDGFASASGSAGQVGPEYPG